MGVTRADAAKQGMMIQSGLLEIGISRVPDLTPEEVVAHQSLLDRLADYVTTESDNQSIWDGESINNLTKWEKSWDLCDRVREIAMDKAPNETAKQVMEKAHVRGGFHASRARKFVTMVVSALEQYYPETYTVLGKTRAQIVEELHVGFASDKVLSDAKAKIQGAQADIRILVPQIDAENDRILGIVDATFEAGTREAEIAARMHLKQPAAKKVVLKDPSH